MSISEKEWAFPPLDKSPSTRIKYDLLAEHIVRSKLSAERKYKPSSYASDVNALSPFFMVLFSLVLNFNFCFFEFFNLS